MSKKEKIEEFKGPTWRYGPNGEAEVFLSVEEVPDGWTDTPQVDGVISGSQFNQPGAKDVVVIAKTDAPEPKKTDEVKADDERAQELFDENNRKGLYDFAKEAGLDVKSDMNKMAIANLISASEKTGNDAN